MPLWNGPAWNAGRHGYWPRRCPAGAGSCDGRSPPQAISEPDMRRGAPRRRSLPPARPGETTTPPVALPSRGVRALGSGFHGVEREERHPAGSQCDPEPRESTSHTTLSSLDGPRSLVPSAATRTTVTIPAWSDGWFLRGSGRVPVDRTCPAYRPALPCRCPLASLGVTRRGFSGSILDLCRDGDLCMLMSSGASEGRTPRSVHATPSSSAR